MTPANVYHYTLLIEILYRHICVDVRDIYAEDGTNTITEVAANKQEA